MDHTQPDGNILNFFERRESYVRSTSNNQDDDPVRDVLMEHM
jgi:hypothetical protein